MSHTIASLSLAGTDSASLPSSALWLLAGCVGFGLGALAVVRLMKLETLARLLLVPNPSRHEIVQRLEQLAAFASACDERAIRRTGDQCSWRLLRRGAELLADGAQPADIAHKLEHIADVLTARRVRLLRKLSSFSLGFVVFPLGVLVAHLFSLIGAAAPTNTWIAGAAFVAALALLVTSSMARWMCERAEDGIALRTIETEALIFGLSAIRGGAGPEEVGSMTRLVLGIEPARSALRQAA
ncbi:MAG: hypothetical protein JNK16_04140 [Phycisphaerales bacterium]|nr:hypothetical protein [Phycisphaerales bacterium]